jgi:phytoene dehydrogenase-like protein
LPLTLPGFLHDHCYAVHPLAVLSPLFRSLRLEERGVRWVDSPAALAHPFDDGTAALLLRSPAAATEGLGSDARAWTSLFRPFAEEAPALAADVLSAHAGLPRRPLLLSRFGALAIRSAAALARGRLEGARGRALLAGLAAHAGRPLEAAATAAFALLLGAAGHGTGWPFPRGGAGSLTAALGALLREGGGEVSTAAEVRSLAELPPAGAVLLDLAPRGVLLLAGDRLPPRYAHRLAAFRHGPGAMKLDWALSGPIPWRARECAAAATVHLGGSLEEIARAEAEAAAGVLPARPFVLLAQHTLFDPTRAPPGAHTAWAYAHVPRAYAGDPEAAAAAVEAQVERFAPGFRELVRARALRPPARLEQEDPNLVGGDVGGGENSLAQLLARPALRRVPWSTPLPGVFLCSASTPPGGGVHGMCGAHAARAALEWLEGGARRRVARPAP